MIQHLLRERKALTPWKHETLDKRHETREESEKFATTCQVVGHVSKGKMRCILRCYATWLRKVLAARNFMRKSKACQIVMI